MVPLFWWLAATARFQSMGKMVLMEHQARTGRMVLQALTVRTACLGLTGRMVRQG